MTTPLHPAIELVTKRITERSADTPVATMRSPTLRPRRIWILPPRISPVSTTRRSISVRSPSSAPSPAEEEEGARAVSRRYGSPRAHRPRILSARSSRRSVPPLCAPICRLRVAARRIDRVHLCGYRCIGRVCAVLLSAGSRDSRAARRRGARRLGATTEYTDHTVGWLCLGPLDHGFQAGMRVGLLLGFPAHCRYTDGVVFLKRFHR